MKETITIDKTKYEVHKNAIWRKIRYGQQTFLHGMEFAGREILLEEYGKVMLLFQLDLINADEFMKFNKYINIFINTRGKECILEEG